MLSGIKVLDLSRVLAGPLCTMMLGDLGADVLKVERPGTGDDTRGWGPPFDLEGESGYYLSINRNKLGIALDLNIPSDLSLMKELAGEADVVVENFLPGTLERRGWGAEECRRQFPTVIWCSITGFGPGVSRPGYDLVVQAESGWMSITGESNGDPMRHGVALADVLTGKDAAIAVLAALAERARTGSGRHVQLSLKSTAEAALINVAQNAMVTGRPPTRWGNAHPNLVPYQLFHAVDRPFVVAVGSDAQWQGCTRALELPELGAEAELTTNAGRIAHRERLIRTVAERIATASATTWCTRLDAEGVPCGIVRTVPEVLAHIDASAQMGLPPSVPGTVRLRPPKLGEHTDIVRKDGWKAFSLASQTRR